MKQILLTNDELNIIKNKIKNINKEHIRIRLNSIILSSKGYSVKEISSMLDISTKTIYIWFDNYLKDSSSLDSDVTGRGNKPLVDFNDYFNEIRIYLDNHNLKQTVSYLQELTNEYISIRMLKKFLKKKGIAIKEQEKQY